MVPMTDQYTVSNTPFGHRVSHVWTTVVNGVKFVAGLENSEMRAVDMKGFALQFLKIFSGAELVVVKFGFVYFYGWCFNVDGTDTGFFKSGSWRLHNLFLLLKIFCSHF